MMTFQPRLKKSRKRAQPKIRFDLEKLNDHSMKRAFQAIITGRFALFARQLVDEDAELDSIFTKFYKIVTDTAHEKKPWVTEEILNYRDQGEDLKKKRSELKGVNDYWEVNKQIRKDLKMENETWTEGYCRAGE